MLLPTDQNDDHSSAFLPLSAFYVPIHSRGRRLGWSDLALLSNFLKPTHGCQSVLFLEVLKGGKILIFKTSYCRYPTNECFFENLQIPFFYCKEPLQLKLLLKFY